MGDVTLFFPDFSTFSKKHPGYTKPTTWCRCIRCVGKATQIQDPTLTDFNFNNLHMPAAHLEASLFCILRHDRKSTPVRGPNCSQIGQGIREMRGNKKNPKACFFFLPMMYLHIGNHHLGSFFGMFFLIARCLISTPSFGK